MDKIYWKFDGMYKAEAKEAYDEISKLDEVTPQNIVNMARNKNSVLHDDFEWDDAVAGEKYREQQAATMIRHLVYEPGPVHSEPMRVYQITTEPRVYKETRVIMQNYDEYQALLKRALAELKGFQNRYRSLTELDGVFSEIDKL